MIEALPYVLVCTLGFVQGFVGARLRRQRREQDHTHVEVNRL